MSVPSADDVRRRFGLAPEAAVQHVRAADGRVTAQPDTFTVVEMTSALEGARWDRAVAVAGSTAMLTVQGTFVGEGAPTDVLVRDARGRTLGRGRATMHADRALVEVAVDRGAARSEPDGVLSAADVEIRDLGLKTISAPLLVLPFAELDGAAWGQIDAREGDVVDLSCALRGSAAGVERVGREPAEIDVLRGASGEDAVFEPVATLRGTFARGRLEAKWRVGYDAEGKARIATQPELDEAAARTGATAERYAWPVYRFRVRVAGLAAESEDLLYRDHVDLAWDAGTERPASGAAVSVTFADGTTLETELGGDGRQRLSDVPPGPVTALFGPDPRVWQPRRELLSPGALPTPAPLPARVVAPPEAPILLASAGGFDPALLASLSGVGPDDDDEEFLDWLWSTMKGDFNEDPDYTHIVANIGASFVPIVGQVMDIRDVIAGLYLLAKDEGWRDGLKWLALFVTLVGIIPVLGDAVKGIFRVALRSIKNSTHRTFDAAADALEASGALEAVFTKVKQILRKAEIDDLEHVPNVATWIRDLDVSWIAAWAKWALETATNRIKSTFEWAAESAERGVLRLGEALAERLNGARMYIGDNVRALFSTRRAPPRVSVPTPSLAARLRSMEQYIETLRTRANAEVDAGINRLYDKLREIVGLPPRARGSGVSGTEVRPAAESSGSARVADDVVNARKELAKRFYLNQGFSDDANLESHLAGINFNHPVEVVPLNVGDRLRQYQVRGSDYKGSYYFTGDLTPTQIGINPEGVLYGTTNVDIKVINEYIVEAPAQALRSTAAAVIDDHSVPSNLFQTVGGGIQFFVKDAPGIVRVP